jgi:hypothetical protein
MWRAEDQQHCQEQIRVRSHCSGFITKNTAVRIRIGFRFPGFVQRFVYFAGFQARPSLTSPPNMAKVLYLTARM